LSLEGDVKTADQAGCSGSLRRLSVVASRSPGCDNKTISHYRNTVQRQRLAGNL